MLDRNQLASRLTLNCTDSYVEPQKLKDVYVTIMDVSGIRECIGRNHGCDRVLITITEYYFKVCHGCTIKECVSLNQSAIWTPLLPFS